MTVTGAAPSAAAEDGSLALLHVTQALVPGSGASAVGQTRPSLQISVALTSLAWCQSAASRSRSRPASRSRIQGETGISGLGGWSIAVLR